MTLYTFNFEHNVCFFFLNRIIKADIANNQQEYNYIITENIMYIMYNFFQQFCYSYNNDVTFYNYKRIILYKCFNTYN